LAPHILHLKSAFFSRGFLMCRFLESLEDVCAFLQAKQRCVGYVPVTMSRLTNKDTPVLTFTTVSDLEAYMCREPRGSAGFWLKLSKVGAATATISKEDAIEAALCCGWIDGQLGKFDEHYFLVRMTPRRPGSRWSAKNRGTADRLAGRGRLRSAGLAEIEAAKADGRWDAAYASQANAAIPDDLAAALASDESAKRFFDKLDGANRFAIIYRVNDAKRPETRAKRIAQFVEMLARGEALHPLKRGRHALSQPET
jgi:uncharacterized protein YdeI (YjbR/CyaY-like superfamily)